MRRMLLYLTMLVTLDQGTKVLAAAYLAGQRLLLLPGWGLTYKVNPGIWLDNSLPRVWLPWLQVLMLLLVAAAALYRLFYGRYYRRSPWVDLGFAALAAAGAGNLLLDRIAAGGARDFLITPIAVCNLADLYISLFWITIVIELIQYPPARRLLRMTSPSRMLREARLLWRFGRLEWRRTVRRLAG